MDKQTKAYLHQLDRLIQAYMKIKNVSYDEAARLTQNDRPDLWAACYGGERDEWKSKARKIS